jgi:hypothetical protein
LYPQNPYQQQSFGGQQSFQGQQASMREQDLAHLIVSELNRVAGEYTTAILATHNLQTRQTFQFLLQKTFHDQGMLNEVIQQTMGYEELPTASLQTIQKELQKQSQTASQLYGFVQQNQMGSLNSQMQMQMQNQMQNQQQNQMQNQRQNQNFGLNQQTFQPAPSQSSSPLFPNGNYGPSSPINYTGSQVSNPVQSNVTVTESPKSRNFSDHHEASNENAKSTQSIQSTPSADEGSKYSF